MSEASSHFESAARREIPGTCDRCGNALQTAPFSGTRYCLCDAVDSHVQRFVSGMDEVSCVLRLAQLKLEEHRYEFLQAIAGTGRG